MTDAQSSSWLHCRLQGQPCQSAWGCRSQGSGCNRHSYVLLFFYPHFPPASSLTSFPDPLDFCTLLSHHHSLGFMNQNSITSGKTGHAVFPWLGAAPLKINLLLREREERGPSLLPFLPEIKAILSSKIYLALWGTCVSLLPAPKGSLHVAILLNGEKEKEMKEDWRVLSGFILEGSSNWSDLDRECPWPSPRRWV